MEREITDASQLIAGREVRFERPDQSVWVIADQLRLGQIVTNLLSNAFKYSPQEAPVIVRLTELGDVALVSVQDGGAGIAIDDQDRVFERFYRADKGLTQTAGGFGLGLYIARRLAEAMGGGLVLSSRPGEGSTFSVSLPLLVATPQADDPGSNAVACVIPTPINTDRIPVNGYQALADADSRVLVRRSD